MKILHTSDWHLGRSLYGKKRYEEFAAFLDWLSDTIEKKGIDILLVSGDIFDNSTPGNRAQELYYRFLFRVSSSCCRHVVIIAGNHDSPSFLNAPGTLLRALNVYVVGSISEDPESEVIALFNKTKPEAIVCAVPYLRDRDIRAVEPGETIDEKNTKLVEGLKTHYSRVCDIAELKRDNFKNAGYAGMPVIAMGHLFTAGGETVDGDGVRELYVGSLAHMDENVFPSTIDYLALGHLHVPQTVGSKDHIRYSGSPLPMGYGEASQNKKVVLIEFHDTKPEIKELAVPCFQQLVRISGTLDDIRVKMNELKRQESRAWIEIEYTGSDIISNLREIIDEIASGSLMEVLRIKNQCIVDRMITAASAEENLEDLDVNDVFNRCLDAYEVTEEDRKELVHSYNEVIKSLHEEDADGE